MRAKLKTMTPMRARSRSPRMVVVSMESRRIRASAAERTGVLPFLTTCLGALTEAAGFVGTTWPVTSQSQTRRVGAHPGEEHADGGEVLLHRGDGEPGLQLLDVGGHGDGLDGAEREPSVLA